MSFFKTNDNVNIYYEVKGEGKPILFISGWSCSTRFFDRNINELSKDYKIIAMDLRGHGNSEKPEHGYRISRFAKDIEEFLEYLKVEDVTAIGWSMGASILWSYIELFGNKRISKLVSIDQSPAQYIGPDWKWGQTGCYDVESFVRLCGDLTYAERQAAEGTVRACLNHEPKEDELNFLVEEIMKCPANVKIEIMRDHTNLDWRDFLPYINMPTLVCVGRKSQVFPWQGSAYVGEKIKRARIEFFENCSHMLFWDEAEKFNNLIKEFVG
ncbi:alpha/beta fold hydrolase [Clostridium cochlearium]|uniref:Alpha/beta hydrolase n=1 Tax=Clostridium cochlearium TaxID=1494 RepID=A0A7Y3Y0H9_CLOCO|nr:alpha/beta hydrolase [Clostridium cochlearium]